MKVVTSHPIIDGVLDQHSAALGDDLGTYRNHVYRCLNYHQLLLGDAVPDTAALAWAVHDLGIWTAKTFDYLSPSADLAALHATGFGITDIDDVRNMVTQHHKLRPTGDRMTDAFKTADLVDVSRGLLASGIERARVRTIVGELPYLGFHAFLARGLTRNAIRHPTRPLPMMRW
jgi:hypothetical protein